MTMQRSISGLPISLQRNGSRSGYNGISRLTVFVRHISRAPTSGRDDSNPIGSADKPVTTSAQVRQRIRQLADLKRDLYPRIKTPDNRQRSLAEFLNQYQQPELTAANEQDVSTVYGRVVAVRQSSSKLAFIEIRQDRAVLQVMVNLRGLGEVEMSQSRQSLKAIRVGDHIEVTGTPFKTDSGRVSILTSSVPTIVSPSLHLLPKSVANPETLARRRHLDLLINPRSRDLLRLRSRVETFLRSYFDDAGFTSVSTPIITFGAGGAQARPFETRATEFGHVPLSLRIAPELFLKRLVVGDLGPVYEIGPTFRNEGVDATHNPEFTMCEFYMPYSNLDKLLDMTETMFRALRSDLEVRRASEFPSLDGMPDFPAGSFVQLEFLPTMKRALAERRIASDFHLSSPTIVQELLHIATDLGIPHPETGSQPGDEQQQQQQQEPTVVQLLDLLASHLVEPLCVGPTWITNHPSVMSPLAKSFKCPTTGEPVAARAELFINGTEYVNCYEEENDPAEQERKFRLQVAERATPVEVGSLGGVGGGNGGDDGSVLAHDGDPTPEIDESYVEALEWGLPPTTGWGCGVDRLVMFFGRTDKIADVLTFGSLRNVVTIGKAGRKGLD